MASGRFTRTWPETLRSSPLEVTDAPRVGGQARGGGSSGAIVRALAMEGGSGKSPPARGADIVAATRAGDETADVHETIDMQWPGADGE